VLPTNPQTPEIKIFISFASRFYRRNASKIFRQIVRRESLNVHFDQADERAGEVGALAAAAVDDDANATYLAAMGPNNVHSFMDAAAACNDVFGDDEPLVRPDLKTAPQHEPAGFLFDEDVLLAEGTSDLLPHDDPAEGRGNHGIAGHVAKFVRQASANFSRNVWVLEKQSALEELPAMEAGTQNEMAVEQRPRPTEKCQQILAH
jgi:hypothetical protein